MIRGIAQREGPAIESPLTHEPVLYCRWSIIRRKLSEGANETVSGEVTTPFCIEYDGRRETIALENCALHLSENQLTAWTTRWDGLPGPVKESLRSHLPQHIEDALYHCEQAALTAGTAVSWSHKPPLLTDLTIAETQAWSLKRPIIPLLIAAILAVSAAAF